MSNTLARRVNTWFKMFFTALVTVLMPLILFIGCSKIVDESFLNLEALSYAVIFVYLLIPFAKESIASISASDRKLKAMRDEEEK